MVKSFKDNITRYTRRYTWLEK